MYPLLPFILFISITIWSVNILRKNSSLLNLFLIFLSFISEIISIYLANKAIDIVDFGINQSEAIPWLSSSIGLFILGLLILTYLSS